MGPLVQELPGRVIVGAGSPGGGSIFRISVTASLSLGLIMWRMGMTRAPISTPNRPEEQEAAGFGGQCTWGLFRLAIEDFVEKIASWVGFERWRRVRNRARRVEGE